MKVGELTIRSLCLNLGAPGVNVAVAFLGQRGIMRRDFVSSPYRNFSLCITYYVSFLLADVA